MKRGWLRSKPALAGLLVLLAQVQGLLAQDPCLTLGIPVWTKNQVQFTLTGESSVSYVIESSPDLLNWLPVLTNTDFNVTRTITNAAPDGTSFYRARRGPLPVFAGALTAQQGITEPGVGLMTDSFDSADPMHSTNGMYDPSKRKAGGDVTCDHGHMSLINATIYGQLYLGPMATYSIGNNGTVGDLNWTGPGVEPGWVVTNFRFCLPDVSWPRTNVFYFPIPGSGTNTWLLASGNYLVTGNFALNQNQNLVVMGNASLYVAGNFTMQSQTASAIIIDPGASLKLYVGTPNGPPVSATLTQVNTTGNAMSFQYFGFPSNTNVAWTGNSTYVGTVYAPEAKLYLGSGGLATTDYQGACVANSIVINNHFNFHFDENLRRVGPLR